MNCINLLIPCSERETTITIHLNIQCRIDLNCTKHFFPLHSPVSGQVIFIIKPQIWVQVPLLLRCLAVTQWKRKRFITLQTVVVTVWVSSVSQSRLIHPTSRLEQRSHNMPPLLSLLPWQAEVAHCCTAVWLLLFRRVMMTAATFVRPLLLH